MKRHILNPLYWLLAAALIGAAFILSGCQQRPVELSPVVKIMAGKGHGSGVSIGNGVIITARHVVGDLVCQLELFARRQFETILIGDSVDDIFDLLPQRFARLGTSLRLLEANAPLDRLFFMRVNRRVRKDATFSLGAPAEAAKAST